MRIIRIFLTLYALALLAINIRTDVHRGDWAEALNVLFPTGAFLLLAVNSWRAKAPGQIATKGWFRAVFWLSIFMAVPALIGVAIEDKQPLSEWWTVALGMGVTIAWYGLCATVAYRVSSRLNSPAPKQLSSGWQRIVMTIIAIGAVAQLSTLLLPVVGHDSGQGWTVIVGKSPWITQIYNVGTPIFWGQKVRWITPVFGPTGRAFYVVCGVCSIILLVLLAMKRMRWEEVRKSRAFLAVAAIQVLYCAFVVNDVRWGAEELSSYPVFATVGAACWAAVIVFAVFVVRTIVKEGRTWKAALLVGLVLPSVMTLAIIFPLILLVESEGLIVLLAGALLSSTACLTLLSSSSGQENIAAASMTAH